MKKILFTLFLILIPISCKNRENTINYEKHEINYSNICYLDYVNANEMIYFANNASPDSIIRIRPGKDTWKTYAAAVEKVLEKGVSVELAEKQRIFEASNNIEWEYYPPATPPEENQRSFFKDSDVLWVSCIPEAGHLKIYNENFTLKEFLNETEYDKIIVILFLPDNITTKEIFDLLIEANSHKRVIRHFLTGEMRGNILK